MASGKSWLSRRLAEQTGIPAFDLDEVIEREQGMEVVEYFRTHGEASFRSLERGTLERLCATIRGVHGEEALEKRDRFPFLAVVATGGGTPCFGDNMDWMNRNGLTLWLDTPLDVLNRRLVVGAENRPLLKGLDAQGIEEAIASLMDARRPFYGKARVRWTGDSNDLAGLIEILEDA